MLLLLAMYLSKGGKWFSTTFALGGDSKFDISFFSYSFLINNPENLFCFLLCFFKLHCRIQIHWQIPLFFILVNFIHFLTFNMFFTALNT